MIVVRFIIGYKGFYSRVNLEYSRNENQGCYQKRWFTVDGIIYGFKLKTFKIRFLIKYLKKKIITWRSLLTKDLIRTVELSSFKEK